MAFIDWLKKQHADSLRASQRMAADPFLRGVQPGVNTAPAPQGAIPFQRTKPGFFARDYKKEDLVKKVMIEKNDGTKEIKSEWEEPRFPVHRGNVRATALPAQQPTSLTPIVPSLPDRRGFANRVGMGGFTGGAQYYDMAQDPGWAGVPRARPQRSLANMGMMDLRPRLEMPGQAASVARSAARIPRQQMPPPRFVPRVDPSQFPTVQDRNTGTYNAGDPGVVLNRGGPSLENLRGNVGEDLRGAWNPIRDRMQKIIEDIRRRREGQTMAPFDWRNN